jgi:uncharacterized membrane protein
MKDILLQEDLVLVEDRLKVFEQNTGCELLLVLAKSSDEYPGATWRFGFISAFLITFTFSLYFEFHHAYVWPLTFFVITTFMVWVGHFTWAKKLALTDVEVNRECFEKSVECFHTLGTSKVSHKVTAMIMVSLLEHKIMILIDEKLKSEITQQELDDLVEIMKKHFKAGNIGLGFTESIVSFEQKILNDFKGKVSTHTGSELSDKVHFI